MSDYNTVNLKEQMEKAKQAQIEAKAEARRLREETIAPQPTKAQKRAEAIDQVYGNDSEDAPKRSDFKTINQPPAKEYDLSWVKPVVIGVVAMVIVVGGYWLFMKNRSIEPKTTSIDLKWYRVELVNGDVYYGQVIDTMSDPVEMKNVYYDYDMYQGTKDQSKETTTAEEGLKLVKRGKEIYSPEGNMKIVRAQVLKFDELGPDSKVLNAILNYENK